LYDTVKLFGALRDFIRLVINNLGEL
jgi:hypothetical protein